MNRKASMVRSHAPQIHARGDTRRLAWAVAACLAPPALWSLWSYGFPALFIILVAVGSALVCEGAVNLYRKELTLGDGTAFLTGLLVASGLPPGAPLYVPAIGSAFAMIVAKWTFGGLGNNFINPALAGKVAVFLSWPAALSSWTMPQQLAGLAGLSGATPLGFARAAGTALQGPMDALSSANFPRSALDSSVTDWVNSAILNPLGASMPGGYVDLFLGNVPGGILEVSAALILLGSVFLLAKEIVSWEIPATFIAAFSACILAFGGLPYGGGLGSGDLLFHLLAGGTLFGAFFFATEPVTSPLSRKGKLIYGAMAGALAGTLRLFGGYSDGIALSILFMNCMTLFIDDFARNRRFGSAGRKA